MRVGAFRGATTAASSGIGAIRAMFSATVPVNRLTLLRQVADVPAERRRGRTGRASRRRAGSRPRGRPEAEQRPRQRRLARAREADHAERLARLHIEADVADRRPARARRQHGELPRTASRAAGAGRAVRAGSSGGVGRAARARRPQPCARALHQRPLAERLLDRRQRAAEHDRACHHRARRHLALQHQIGAERQHRRLQEQPERSWTAAVKRAGQCRWPQSLPERLRPRCRFQRPPSRRACPGPHHLGPGPDLPAKTCALPCVAALAPAACGCAVIDLVGSGDADQDRAAGHAPQPEAAGGR